MFLFGNSSCVTTLWERLVRDRLWICCVIRPMEGRDVTGGWRQRPGSIKAPAAKPATAFCHSEPRSLCVWSTLFVCLHWLHLHCTMSKSGFKGEGKSRLFKPCVSPCKRFITAGDTHEQCAACLGAGHTAAAFSEGADCPHCERLPLRTLRSRKSLFVDGIFTSEPRGSGPAAAEAERRLHSWGSQFDLEQEMETGESLSPSTASRSSARSGRARSERKAASSRGTGSTLDQSSFKEEEMESVDEPPQSLQYEELLEVVTRTVMNLKLIGQPSSRPSRVEASSTSVSCALGRHLRIGACLFFPICILRFVDRGEDRTRPASSFQRLTIMGMSRVWMSAVNRAMPKVEQTLASYLSRVRGIVLEGSGPAHKAFVYNIYARGQGVLGSRSSRCVSAHMSVLQAYQADLLKELNEREQVSSDDIAKLRRTADLSLRATKETARALGALWLLWWQQRDICGWPCQIWRQVAAFQRFLPRRSRAQGAAGRSSPRRVPAPHTGRLKRRALPLVLPRGGARSSTTRLGLQVEAGSGSVLTARRSQKKKSWHMGVQDFWGQAPLGKKGITGCLSLPSALDAALSPTQGDWDTRHPWGGL